jgi:hypothetical protein
MNHRRMFEPGDMVATFTGQAGMVISLEAYEKAKEKLEEGRRPGHYFAPGCCQNPDYVTQVPVLFEDGTYDVMRAMNLKQAATLSSEKRARVRGILDRIK